MGESGVLTFHQNVRGGELLKSFSARGSPYKNAVQLCLVGHTSLTAHPPSLYVMGLHLNEGSGVEWGERGWGWGSSQ